MNIPTIAQIMKRDCEFLRYQDHTLWYRVSWWNEIRSGETYTAGVYENFDFPVPLDEHAAGEFLATMKALNLMRWIRQHRDFLLKAVEAAQEPCDDCGRTDGHNADCFYHGPY